MASFRVLTAIAWAGQLHGTEPLSHDQVIDGLALKDFAKTVEICNDALIDALGGDDAELSEEDASAAKKKD